MDKKQIIAKLKTILDKADVDSNGFINRKMSPDHNDEIEVLLEHISLLIANLKFDTEATTRELFEVRALLEE